MARLADAAAVGELPERVEAPLVDRHLLLGADLARPGLDGQRGPPGAAADADLDAVGRDRQIALLDALAGVLGEIRRQLGDEELALDLDAGPWDGTLRRVPTTPIELLLPPALDREAAVALLAKRLRLEAGRPRSAGSARARQLRRPPARRRAAGRAPARPPRRDAHDPRARRAGRGASRWRRRSAIWSSELPDGPVRRRLADVLEMRALLPVVRAAQQRAAAGGGQPRRQDGGAARDRARRGGRRLAARARCRRG